MTIKQIAEFLADVEGGKSQIKMGDAREAVAIISDLCAMYPDVVATLIGNGIRRRKKKGIPHIKLKKK